MCVQITYHLNLIYQYFKIGCLENIEPIDILDIKVIQSNYWGRWPLFLCSFVSFCKAIFFRIKIMHACHNADHNKSLLLYSIAILQNEKNNARIFLIPQNFFTYNISKIQTATKFSKMEKWKNACSARGCVIKAKSTSFFLIFPFSLLISILKKVKDHPVNLKRNLLDDLKYHTFTNTFYQ